MRAFGLHVCLDGRTRPAHRRARPNGYCSFDSSGLAICSWSSTRSHRSGRWRLRRASIWSSEAGTGRSRSSSRESTRSKRSMCRGWSARERGINGGHSFNARANGAVDVTTSPSISSPTSAATCCSHCQGRAGVWGSTRAGAGLCSPTRSRRIRARTSRSTLRHWWSAGSGISRPASSRTSG